MDILFVYPPISVNERYNKNLGKVGGDLPPLGIAQLASYLREKKFEVGLIDAVALDYTVEKLIEEISLMKPKIVGFSALTSNFNRAVSAATAIKKKFPKILTLIGGHHATILPKEVIKQNKCFDILVFGEGELTSEKIIREYKKTKWDIEKFLENYNTLEEIKGIVFRKKGKIIQNEAGNLIKNLDELPYIARDLLPMKKYQPLPNQYKRKPIIHMVVIRGCPFNCSFCSNNAVFGRKIRAMSPKRVVEEIKYVIKEYGAKEISFWDDMLTVNKKWINEFCNLLIKNKVDITWTCYSRVDTINLEMLKLMKKAGCWNIFFGYESGNQELLNNINKGTNLQQIEQANKWCKEAGIEIRASFMIALPGETPEMAQKTIEFAKRLDPDYAQFCITTPFPGTKLFKDYKKYGKLTNNYSDYNIWKPVFIPKGYKNKEEIEEMERKAMTQFYLRPKYILGRIKSIKNLDDIKRYIDGMFFVLGFVKK
ncbi:MAG: radical SAM protein [Methanobacterium sp.]|nr:radical SAM protein [Methanobacterium sp.]